MNNSAIRLPSDYARTEGREINDGVDQECLPHRQASNLREGLHGVEGLRVRLEEPVLALLEDFSVLRGH